MKIFGFYITRINWEQRNNSCLVIQKQYHGIMQSIVNDLKCQLAISNGKLVDIGRKKPLRDEKGQFTSKRKQTHDQLRAEQAYTVDWVKLREGL